MPDRTAKTPTQLIPNQPREWRENIQWVTLNLSGFYKAAFDSNPLKGEIGEIAGTLGGSRLDRARDLRLGSGSEVLDKEHERQVVYR